MADPTKPRPTHVRHLIIAVATLMAVMLYLHRFALSFLERYINEDLGLTTSQIGLLFGAFFAAYALGQVPGGWLGDRWGIRRSLTLYIFVWSLFTGLMGAAAGFAGLLGLRLGCGLAQAGAYPSGAALVSRWVPIAGRGFASSVVAFGGRIGAAVVPVMTAYLLVAFVPQDAPVGLTAADLFDVPGLCRRLTATGDDYPARLGRRIAAALPSGVVPPPEEAGRLVAGLNELLDRRDLCGDEEVRQLPLPPEARALARQPRDELPPTRLRRLNRLTLEAAYPNHIKKLYGQGWRPVLAVYGVLGVLVAGLFWLCFRDRPASHPLCNPQEVALIEAGRPAEIGKPPPLPLGPLLRSRSMWLVSLSQFTTNFGWVFLVTWLPRYLADVHNVPIVERGWMAAVPLVFGMAGMLTGGWLTDRLTLALGVRWGRCLPLAASRFAAMAAFAACLLFRAPWPVVLSLGVVALMTDLGTPALWAYNQDVGGRYVGAVLGWNNMWGNFGAAVAPWVLDRVIGVGWDQMFLTCAAAFLVSGVVSLGVDASVPIVAKETPVA
ncbi:MAG TPA: MFS transporter [Gemmataceae bacterium]|nr:MFS transporter [Gemmataceae bacterium]